MFWVVFKYGRFVIGFRVLILGRVFLNLICCPPNFRQLSKKKNRHESYLFRTWIFLCLFRSFALVKRFPHVSHACLRSP
jgi:hypothetical protein